MTVRTATAFPISLFLISEDEFPARKTNRHACQMKTRGKKRKRASLSYTKGNLNKIVDAICHPFFEKNESFRLVDVFLHGLVEQNPRVTIRKFVEYNLPTLTRQLEKAIKKL